MRYPEALRGGTSTGFMSFCMSSAGPVPIRLPNFTAFLPGQSNTGLGGSSPLGLLGSKNGTERDVPGGFLSRIWKSCEVKYFAPHKNWDMTRTCGTEFSCDAILNSVTPYLWEFVSVKDCFTNSVLHSNDLAAKRKRLIQASRRRLKKLRPVDERPQCSDLVSRRSPFPKAQYLDTNVGLSRATALCGLGLDPTKSQFLRGSQSQNGEPFDPGGVHFQRPNLWRLCPLPASEYQGKSISRPGQRSLAQSTRFERVIPQEPTSRGAHLPASLFPRTQPGRAGLEDQPQACNTQPVFCIGSRDALDLDLPLCQMETTKQHIEDIMRIYLRRYI